MRLIGKYFKYSVVLSFFCVMMGACKNESSGFSAAELAILANNFNTVSYKETLDDDGIVFKISG